MGRKECFYLVLILKAINFINCSYSPNEIQKQPSTGAHQNRLSKKFAKFTRKHLPWILFFNKVTGLHLLKRYSGTGVFLRISLNF